jgi:hypothetical protein
MNIGLVLQKLMTLQYKRTIHEELQAKFLSMHDMETKLNNQTK